jgi:bifunctional DNase/RNase
VLMHYLDGLSCQEIAALLGERTGTVRVRLHRARRRLRTQLHIHQEEVRAMVEVAIEDVVVRILAEDADAEHPRLAKEHVRVVLLREKEGERVLPIWVGPPEGDALALHLAGASFPRPITADLMARLLDAAGARIERVVVNSLRENTFYATVSLVAKGEVTEVDARPSDAFNLALRVGAPIFVDSEVMEKAIPAEEIEGGMTALEREWLGGEGEPEPPSEWRSLTPELVRSFYPAAGRK